MFDVIIRVLPLIFDKNIAEHFEENMFQSFDVCYRHISIVCYRHKIVTFQSILSSKTYVKTYYVKNGISHLVRKSHFDPVVIEIGHNSTSVVVEK